MSPEQFKLIKNIDPFKKKDVPYWAILLICIMCGVICLPGLLTFLALIGIYNP